MSSINENTILMYRNIVRHVRTSRSDQFRLLAGAWSVQYISISRVACVRHHRKNEGRTKSVGLVKPIMCCKFRNIFAPRKQRQKTSSFCTDEVSNWVCSCEIVWSILCRVRFWGGQARR